MTNILSIHHMTETEYDREREQIGPSKQAAGIRWEQALALLFYRSGWTQEELAKKEGKSRIWIQYRLRFGRFLGFVTTVTNSENPVFLLSEGRFRSFWERTSGDNERARFQTIIRLIEEAEVLVRAKPRAKIGPDILKAFADGKWHRPETIARRLNTDVQHVEATIANLSFRRIAQIERGRTGSDADHNAPGNRYRIFRKDRTVSLNEAISKLAPIIEELITLSHRAPGTIPNPSLTRMAAEIQNMLDAWSE